MTPPSMTAQPTATGDSLSSEPFPIAVAEQVPAAAPPAPKPSLALVRELCGALRAEHVNYNHWKSNTAIDRSATGENDLDLLISRADAQKFTEILFRLGFKACRHQRAVRELPGILDFYGYDAPSKTLVHVHAHYQLIMGDDMTKNYHVPIESAYLASSVDDVLFKVPSVEFEYAIFVLRMTLKHAAWDAALMGQGKLSKSAKSELDDLESRMQLDVLHDIVRTHLPFIGVELFERCRRILLTRCSLLYRIRTGQLLQAALRGQARQSLVKDVYLKLTRRVAWGTRRFVFRKRAKKRLIQGGQLIALVGSDGSGKSTAVSELKGFLGKALGTTRIHLGKPRWSLTTLVAKCTIKGLRVARVLPATPEQFGVEADGRIFKYPGFAWLVWTLVTARDRYRAYLRARRIATNGDLAICDRFPCTQLRSMDGPRIGEALAFKPESRLVQWMAAKEQSYYRSMATPDLLIVLSVDPEVAAQRRADENVAAVRRRAAEVQAVDWNSAGAQVVDANLPQAEVFAQLRSLVWSRL